MVITNDFESALQTLIRQALTSNLQSADDIRDFACKNSLKLCQVAHNQEIGTLVIMDFCHGKLVKYPVYMNLPDYDECVQSLGYNLDEVHYMVVKGADIETRWFDE